MNTEYKDLLKIYSYRRQHDSQGEIQFAKDYLDFTTPIKDSTGEIIAYKYENAKKSKNNILWTAHIDTVHYNAPDKVYQEVFLSEDGHTARVTKTAPTKNNYDPRTVKQASETNTCLGADDGTGVWLLLQMIKANVHGTYIFFRGEEQGCIGSKALAEEQEEYLKQFTHAIAFDRMGTTDVITKQSYSTCASDKFAKAFATATKSPHIALKPCPNGVYTDTAEFPHLIPECTNISVGYINQHSDRETQDLKFLINLRDSIIKVDWATVDLPATRKPEAKDVYGFSNTWGNAVNDDWSKGLYSNAVEEVLWEAYDIAKMSDTQLEKHLAGMTALELRDTLQSLAESYVDLHEMYESDLNM